MNGSADGSSVSLFLYVSNEYLKSWHSTRLTICFPLLVYTFFLDELSVSLVLVSNYKAVNYRNVKIIQSCSLLLFHVKSTEWQHRASIGSMLQMQIHRYHPRPRINFCILLRSLVISCVHFRQERP